MSMVVKERGRWVAIGLALAAAACGGSGSPTGGGPPPPPPPPPVAPPGDVGFTIVDNAFVDPQGRRNENASVTMTANQMVGWIHAGANLHTVTFTSVPAGAVTENSGNMTNGQTHVQTLATPGTYVFRCDIHPAIMRDVRITVN